MNHQCFVEDNQLTIRNLERINDLSNDQWTMLINNNTRIINSNLTDLAGMPVDIKLGNFLNTGGKLRTLYGAPKVITGTFRVYGNIELTNLNFSPKSVGVEFSAS